MCIIGGIDEFLYLIPKVTWGRYMFWILF